jgi:hypothetical protein
MYPTCHRIALAVLMLALCAAPAAAQQANDLLEAARQRREVEAQRVERLVREGRDFAYRTARTDAARAVERVRTLMEVLDKDESLSPARRDLLARTLKRDVALLQGLATQDRPAPAGAAARAPVAAEARRTEDPRRSADPRSAYDAARRRFDAVNDRVAEDRSSRRQSGERFAGAMGQVDASTMLPASDYDLPKDWAEKSKRRSSKPKLTEGEKALLEALKKPIAVDFSNDTFSSVIEYLQKATGQTIVLEKQALEEANVSYDTPVTLRLPKVATRTVLRRLLSDLGLTYVIKDETIQVTTPARAKEMMVTRVYYVGDLLPLIDFTLPPWENQRRMIEAINSIVTMIPTQVDPSSWQTHGGSGTIVFEPVTMSLIIKNSAEMHYMLGGKP